MKEETQTIENMPAHLRVKNLKDVLPKNKKGGIKADSGKLSFSLLPIVPLKKITKVLMHGAAKYCRSNWKKVERTRYVDALLRHIFAFLEGEALDEDSGQSHLAHAACCVMFLLEQYQDNEAYNPEEVLN